MSLYKHVYINIYVNIYETHILLIILFKANYLKNSECWEISKQKICHRKHDSYKEQSFHIELNTQRAHFLLSEGDSLGLL